MPRKSRQIWRTAVWAIGLALFILFIVLPVAASFLFRYADLLPDGLEKRLDIVETLLSYLMLTFCVVWVFFVGGTFASFLNVVAWRVPRGKSILGSSHCPFCNVKLTFRDNVPVFGWVKNWGRCSNCSLPISPRYVLVEIALGLIFLLVVSLLLLTGGATLPGNDGGPKMMFSRLLLEPRLDLVSVLVFHLAAILGIFTFVLIELERLLIPRSVYLVTMVLLTATTLLLPDVQVVDLKFPFGVFTIEPVQLRVLSTLVAGTIAGFVVGLMIDWLLRNENGIRLAFGMSIVGAIAGWQSVMVVACFWAILNFAIPSPNTMANGGNTELESTSVLENLQWSPNAKLLAALLLHLATWSWFGFLV